MSVDAARPLDMFQDECEDNQADVADLDLGWDACSDDDGGQDPDDLNKIIDPEIIAR